MTFTTDQRVVQYREAIDGHVVGKRLVDAETSFVNYMVTSSPDHMRAVVVKVLAREGFSHAALAAGAGLTDDERLTLPAPDRGVHDRVTALRALPYSEYLKTDHWQLTRHATLRRANYRCQICGETDGLEVHHNTYERRGEELPTDLFVLCAACHQLFHEHGKLAA